MHRFTISICDTVPTFNDNLMTRFKEGKRYSEIWTIKIFVFENRWSDVQKYCVHQEKKENNMSDKLNIPNRGIYIQKLPCYWLMNQSFSVMF